MCYDGTCIERLWTVNALDDFILRSDVKVPRRNFYVGITTVAIATASVKSLEETN